MKKILRRQFITIITFITIINFITSPSLSAQTRTASPSASPSASVKPTKSASPSGNVVDREIQNLKEKIATKVAELRKKNLKAVAGVIEESSKDTLTIKSVDGEEYTVTLDDSLTKIFQIAGAAKKELKASDLKKDGYAIVSGPVSDKTVTANYVYLDEQYIVKTGKVTEVDKEENIVKTLTSDKDNYTLDIEVASKMQMLDSKTLEIANTTFSKLREGDTIHFIVKKTGKEKEVNRYSAERILVIPQEYFIK